MHRFSIFSLFSIIVFMTFNAGAARAYRLIRLGESMRVFLLMTCLLFLFSTSLTWADVKCSARLSATPANSTVSLEGAANADCTEYWSGNLPRTGVPAVVMIQTGLDTPAGFDERVKQGLIQAESALSKLRSTSGAGNSITVIIGEADDDVNLGFASLIRGHCYIVVLPTSWRDRRELGEAEFTMAHEMFHCIQEANLSAALIFAGDETANDCATCDKNLWWSEGSAEWFAHVAHPGASNLLVGTYEVNAEPHPMTIFRESVWPFFAWYAEKYGHTAVLPFLSRIPATEHDRFTIAELLSPQDWGDFATLYSAYQIHKIDGRTIDPGVRATREVIEITEDASYSFGRAAGHLVRHEIVLSDGVWELNTSSNGPMFISEINGRNDPDGNWERFSGTLERATECGETKRYALAGYGVEPSDDDFEFKAEKTGDTCDLTCSSLPTERPMCVIGIWEDQGPIEQYLSETQTTREATITPIVTLYPDGSYTRDTKLRQVNEAGPVTVTTTLDVSQTLGRWGTRGSKLTVCETRQINIGTVHSVGSGLDMTIPINTDDTLDPERTAKYTYTCNDSTLTLKRKLLGWTPYGENLTFKRQ